jgi:antitoxin component YwqK of YwqJK toxin-antitoxin module
MSQSSPAPAIPSLRQLRARFRSGFCALGLSVLASCGGAEEGAQKAERPPAPGVRVEIGEAGILLGEEKPFTGEKVEQYRGGATSVSYTFESGVLQKKVEYQKSGSRKRETLYRDGEAYFQTVWRSDGGKKIETGLKDGVPHGPHKRWHANGKIGWTGEFHEGKFHGLVEDRDENGVLLIKGRYDKGALVEDLLPQSQP